MRLRLGDDGEFGSSARRGGQLGRLRRAVVTIHETHCDSDWVGCWRANSGAPLRWSARSPATEAASASDAAWLSGKGLLEAGREGGDRFLAIGRALGGLTVEEPRHLHFRDRDGERGDGRGGDGRGSASTSVASIRWLSRNASNEDKRRCRRRPLHADRRVRLEQASKGRCVLFATSSRSPFTVATEIEVPLTFAASGTNDASHAAALPARASTARIGRRRRIAREW